MEWLWLKSLASLLLILGLIVATLWILKRFMTFARPASGAPAIAMEVAGVLHLAPRRSVYAVKTGGQVILLGVAEQGVTYLTQLPEASCSPVKPEAQGGGLRASQSPFFRILAERFKNGAPGSVPAPAPTAASAPVQAASYMPLAMPDVVKKAKAPRAPRKKAPKQ